MVTTVVKGRHTQEVRCVEVVDEWQSRDDRRTRNAAHGDQRNQSDLSPPLQLQMPYQEARNNREGEVGDDAEHAVDIAKRGDDSVVNALSLLRSAIPHVRNRVALEQTNEEKGASSDDRDTHCTPDDPDILSACRKHDLHVDLLTMYGFYEY